MDSINNFTIGNERALAVRCLFLEKPHLSGNATSRPLERSVRYAHNEIVDSVSGIQRFWSGLRKRQALVPRTIRSDEVGVTQIEGLGDREVQERIAWDDISAVFAYKQDCFAVDRIWVAVADRNGKIRIEVSEDDAGYDCLVNELPRRLSGCQTAEQ
jgi:hypothetical protein